MRATFAFLTERLCISSFNCPKRPGFCADYAPGLDFGKSHYLSPSKTLRGNDKVQSEAPGESRHGFRDRIQHGAAAFCRHRRVLYELVLRGDHRPVFLKQAVSEVHA